VAEPREPEFLTRFWKGGASAPPLEGLSEFSRVPRPSQLAAASCEGRGTDKGWSRDFGGAEAPPFRQPPRAFQPGEKSGLGPRLFLVHRGRAADLKKRGPRYAC